MKMPGFTALNGAGSPRSPADDTIEVRLPPTTTSRDEREYDGTSTQTAEPRTVPDITTAARRERDIWGRSERDRPIITSYWREHPPPRKRVRSIDESARMSQEDGRSQQQHHQHQHSTGSGLPRILSATETAAAAVAAVASAASSNGDRPHLSVESRDPYDLPRSSEFGSKPQYGGDDRSKLIQQQRQREQHEREQQQREQNRKELWYSQPSQEDRRPSVPYDTAVSSTAAYHQRSGSLQSPVEEHSGNDSQHRSKSVARASGSPQSEYAGRTPDEEDRQGGYSGTPFSPSQQRKSSSSAQQSDPKRRKRNFSNRTKTGCLTCRKRKKKCDETKPECSNCVRGGFICAGYPPQKGQWAKTEPGKPAVQIESKDPNYVPPGAYGMPGPHSATQPTAPLQPPQRRESMPTYRGPSLRIEPPQGRPITTDDDRPTASTLPSALTSAADSVKLSSLSAFSAPANGANAFPTPISAATSAPFLRTPKDYQRVPPLLELARNAEPETPQHTHLPMINFPRSSTPSRMEQSPQQMQLPLPSHSQQQQQKMQPQQLPPPAHPQALPDQSQPLPQSTRPPHADREGYSQHRHNHQSQDAPRGYPQDYAQEYQREQPAEHQTPEFPYPNNDVHQQHSPRQFHPQAQQTLAPQPNSQAHTQQQPSPVEGPLPFDEQHPFTPPPMERSPSPIEDERQLRVQTHQLASDEEEDGVIDMRPRRRPGVPFFDTIIGPRRERDEMNAGRPFYQFDMELVEERERCSAACWKFNNAMNPSLGLSPVERSRLFKEILQPRDEMTVPPLNDTEIVGEKVTVEAPFHADYGYNIQIGSEVFIGRNCHISDAVPVSIGSRVYIGPNVSFYSTKLASDGSLREGVHSALYGSGITIGDNVYIEGNVTILAGVNIGHGSVIRAGSVVSAE